MATVRMPLSGNVTQTLNPWTWVFNTQGSQIGLFNLSVDLGQSSDPEAERAILNVASYGKQLGRMGDVVDALLLRLKQHGNLSETEQVAIADYEAMRREIARAKT